MSYIAAIETAVPEYCHDQEDISMFFQNSTTETNIKRKIKVVNAKSGIKKRYSVIRDYSSQLSDFEFFPKNIALLPEPSLSERMAIFKEQSIKLSIKAIRKIKKFDFIKDTITHVITVTCTGLFAPGLDVEIIKDLELNPATQRSSINFMGCNAAILALNNANAICNSIPNSKVLVVCTELCTLHFQKNYSDDYILSTALFGDGCAVALISSERPTLPYIQGLKIKSFKSLLIHKGFNEMAWQLSEKGFIMNLTSYVSELINGQMKQFLDSIYVNPSEIDLWAIHPGGKKILDNFQEVLNLKPQALAESYDVLKNYGNMSSATILFVIKQVIENRQNNDPEINHKRIFTAAFGPGLSVETMQLEYRDAYIPNKTFHNNVLSKVG